MKPFKKYIAAILVSLIFSPISYSETGNSLLRDCIKVERSLDGESEQRMTATDYFWAGRCMGLVRGVLATMSRNAPKGPAKLCLPASGVSDGQSVRIVLSYLRKNPANLHKDDALLAKLAFSEAFSCK
jgi:hypothetical protein